MNPTTPSPSASNPGGLFKRTLKRWWGLILGLWVLGSAGLVALVWKGATPTYQATAMLTVKSLTPNLYGVATAPSDLDEFRNTQVYLVTSPDVLGVTLSKH